MHFLEEEFTKRGANNVVDVVLSARYNLFKINNYDINNI